MGTDDVIGITTLVVCVLAILPLALTHGSFRVQELSETWRKLAERRGWRFEPGRRGKLPSAAGSVGGRDVQLGKSGTEKNPVLFIEMSLRGRLPAGLQLSSRKWLLPQLGGPDGAFARLARLTENDAEVLQDEALKRKASDAEELQRYLTAPRRMAALRLSMLGGELKDNKLRVIVTKSARELEDLDLVIDELGRIAPVLDPQRGRPAGGEARPAG